MGAYAGWAIVELFGHVRLAGIVSEAEQYGAKMLRVEVPEVDGAPGFTTFKGGSALYAVTPTTEEIARHIVRQQRPAPVSPYELPQRKALPASDADVVDDSEDDSDTVDDPGF